MKKLLILLIRFYQVTVSPLIGPVCRFYPSCSHYAIEAIEKKGILKGSYLTVKRLLKCAPWHPGGIDFPVSEGDDPASTDRL